MTGLSDRAKQLIPKARIVSFAHWQEAKPDIIARFQAADDTSQYLSDDDLAMLSAAMPTGYATLNTALSEHGLSLTDVVKQLRDQAPAIVDEARAGVLEAFPNILEPGGGLYPPMRAEACWRDFWQFLRCITYGIASGQTRYTSTEGLAAMEELYEELKVPLPAMVTGLKGIKSASLKRLPAEAHSRLAPYFDHLIAQLSAFLD
ncbi:MAG: phycobilisome protein [Cyanobacteria bacterium J06560_5]